MTTPHVAPPNGHVNGASHQYTNGAADHTANGASNGAKGHLTPGDVAADFLRAFDPTGWHSIVRIDPETGITAGQTFPPGDWDEIRGHINSYAGKGICTFR